jgi:hypothetical protein
MAWAFVPQNPNELTLALRGPEPGNGVKVVGTERFQSAKGILELRFLAVMVGGMRPCSRTRTVLIRAAIPAQASRWPICTARCLVNRPCLKREEADLRLTLLIRSTASRFVPASWPWRWSRRGLWFLPGRLLGCRFRALHHWLINFRVPCLSRRLLHHAE